MSPLIIKAEVNPHHHNPHHEMTFDKILILSMLFIVVYLMLFITVNAEPISFTLWKLFYYCRRKHEPEYRGPVEPPRYGVYHWLRDDQQPQALSHHSEDPTTAPSAASSATADESSLRREQEERQPLLSQTSKAQPSEQDQPSDDDQASDQDQSAQQELVQQQPHKQQRPQYSCWITRDNKIHLRPPRETA
ncbi:hypothetical protein F5Y18DRAFT_429337 [Xylariaceae sp. FL1019]|nr:hypothetical protein F5Y18DRAFT_429337 [Xylariaceae sp. FL1019]